MSVLSSQFHYENSRGEKSPFLRELVHHKEWSRDEHFLSRYLKGETTRDDTFVSGIKKIFLNSREVDCRSFEEALDHGYRNLEKSLVYIALSGGLDSQFLALDLKKKGYHVIGVSLRSYIPGYCEWEKTSHFAQAHNISLIPLDVDQSDFYKGLNPFLKVVEEPIYNLHAVSKFLLASKLQERGMSQCVSGDGADQIFAGLRECDLFRFTQKSFSSQGVTLVTPLATEEMRGFVKQHGPQDKRALFQMNAEKSSCYFPDEGKEKILELSLNILEEHFSCVE